MEKLFSALDRFKDKTVIVMGDIMLDKFCWGNVERLNPEQPAAPNINIGNETYSLGGAANTANNVASLGGNCILYGSIGKDSYGEEIKKFCSGKGIFFNYFHDDNATIVKQRIMAHNQQIARLNYGEYNRKNLSKEIRQNIISRLKEDIKSADVVVLSDYNKRFFDKEISKEIIDLTNMAGVATIVDSKPVNMDLFRKCTIIKANKHEASARTSMAYSDNIETLIGIGKKLTEATCSKYAVITCGKDGAFAYSREGDISSKINTKAREVNDVTGAGDTFSAILALALASNLNLSDSINLANYGSGMVVEKVGTAVTSIDEIKKRILLDKKI